MPDTPAPSGRSSWVEGERVFGPPTGTWDADWVAGAACALDPALERARAEELARQAWAALRAGVPPQDLPGLLGPDGGAVAAVAAEFCALYGVQPQG